MILLLTQSCASNFMENFKQNTLAESSEDYSAQLTLNKTRELLDGASITFPTLTATGYAVVSIQPGQSTEQKRLMAIRAARMSAIERIS